MIEPLVLLPAFMCDSRMYRAQIEALSREMPVTVAPFGRGERVEEVASDLLAQLPGRFALAGSGLGGIVAMEILRRAPERVTRLALIATTPLPESPAFAAGREARIVAARSGRLAEVMREEMPAAAFAPGPGRAALLAELGRMAAELGPDAFVRQTRLMQRRKDQQAVLRRIRAPAAILCGYHDSLTPVRRHEFMAELVPYARLDVLADAGHLPTMEAPDETTALLRDWLRQPLVLR